MKEAESVKTSPGADLHFGEHLDIEPVVARRTIQEGVYQGIVYALMSGQFNPGQTLTISAISSLFGTSHMPVREALRRLAAEGALENSSTGSARVPNVSCAKLADICLARQITEGAAAELATAHIDASTIRALEHNLADHIVAGKEQNVQLLLAKNQEFHFTLYRLSRSDVLIQLIQTLWLRFGPYLRMLSSRMEPMLKSRKGGSYTRHHKAIIDALKIRDGAAVRQHLIADIEATHALLQTLVPEESPKVRPLRRVET